MCNRLKVNRPRALSRLQIGAPPSIAVCWIRPDRDARAGAAVAEPGTPDSSRRGGTAKPVARGYFLGLGGAAIGWEAVVAAAWLVAGRAAKPLATSSAAFASRIFNVVLSSTTTMTRWLWRAAVTAME